MKKSTLIVNQPAFSNWLKTKRQERNISNADLIRLAHGQLSERTIKSLIAGKQKRFRESTFIELAKVLEIPFDQFLDEVENLNNARFSNRFSKSYLSLSFAIIVLFVLGFFLIENYDNYREPFEFDIMEQGFHVLDVEGSLLFSKPFYLKKKSALIIDLNNNGKKEIVLAVHGYKTLKPAESGNTIAYSYAGEELWRFYPFKEIFYNSGGNSNRYRTSELLAGNFLNKDKIQLLLSYKEIGWFPSGLVMVNHNGEELRRYWHPGHIQKTVYEPKNNLIAISAVNNHFKEKQFSNIYPNTFALIKADSISGQAPPYNGLGLKQGSHLWYKEIKPVGSMIGSIIFTDYGADGEIDIEIGVDDQVYYIFDIKGNLLARLPWDTYKGKTHTFIDHE
jgi:transcriptional regulator with XRE-family HTH domain